MSIAPVSMLLPIATTLGLTRNKTMKQSLTYYITLLVIRLKGLKKDFSKDPIDFKKIRKEDVHYPKGKFFRQNKIRNFRVLDSLMEGLLFQVPHNIIGILQKKSQLKRIIRFGCVIIPRHPKTRYQKYQKI
jgi:hypothetical protein